MDLELVDETENQDPLAEIKEKAAEAGESGASLMSPGSKIKKPRGPYKKKDKKQASEKAEGPKPSPEKENPPQQVPTEQIAKNVLASISNVCVSYTNHPKGGMSEAEIDQGSKALALVMDKYLPYAFANFGAEIMLGMVLVPYATRVVALKRLQRIEEEKRRSVAVSPFNVPPEIKPEAPLN